MAKSERLKKAAHAVLVNLETVQINLDACVDAGMIDSNSSYHNELCDLIDETRILETWEELEAVVFRGKALETDVDAWLSQKGRTTIALPWPNRDTPLEELD